MPTSMSIGLVAYNVNPQLVFVRVPTERGRFVLTDRCVVEVDCPACGAISGEPCRRGAFNSPRPVRHGSGTHWRRRDEWQRIKRDQPWRDPVKVRITAQDLADATGEAEA